MGRITETAIEFGLFDVTASEDAQYQTSQKQSWNSAESQLKQGGTSKNYATLEMNDFVLDGSAEFFPDNPGDEFFGWWSRDLSGADGVFSNPPVLTVNFTEKHSSMGITIYFPDSPNEWAGSLNIKWYDGIGNILNSKDFYPDKAIYFCEQSVTDFEKVELTFFSTALPHRYLKVSEIMFGLIKMFTGKDLESARIYEEIDPVSSSLPINTLNFSFRDSEGKFSPLNLEGTYALFQQRQWFKVRSYINGVKNDLGTYYYSNFEVPDTEDTVAQMSCVNLLGVIDTTEFKGGIYTDKPALDLVSEILTSAGLGASEWTIDESLSDKRLTGWIPICSHREALRQVVFAIGGMVDCTRSEKISIYPMPSVQTAVYDTSRKISGHKIKFSSMVTGCEVAAHQYRPIYKFTEDETEIVNDTLTVGKHEIKFKEPMHDLKITTGTASILESGANYAVLNVTTEETVVLKGEEYYDNVTVFGYYKENLPAHQKPNVISLAEDMTLISKDNAQEIAQRIYEYYQNRYSDQGDVILDFDTDKVGSIAKVESTAGSIQGIVISIDCDLVNGVLGEVKTVGKVV